MFGYKLVKKDDYKSAIQSLNDCVLAIDEAVEIIDYLDLPEIVKAQLWSKGTIALACIIDSELRMSGHGNFDFKKFFEERFKKDEA